MVEVMKIMGTSFKRSHVCTAVLSAADPAAGHLHPRPLDTHGQVWVSLLWGHCSFLLHPGAHKVLFVPSKSLLPQSWVSSSGSMVGLMATFFKKACAVTQVCCTQHPCRCSRPLLTCTSAGDTQTQFWLSLCEVSGSWCTHSLFEPFECLWRVWGLILSVILPLLLSCWGFSFALVRGVSFFGGIQHSPLNGCPAASCNFGVLADNMSACPSLPSW